MDRMGAWLFVLGDPAGIEWVLAHERMAFTSVLCTRARRMEPGDLALIYATKTAYKGGRGYSRIIAVAEVTGPAHLLGEPLAIGAGWYDCVVPLRIAAQADPLTGVPFAPLVDQLDFIKQKKFWSHYVRAGLVSVPAADGQLLARAFENWCRTAGLRSN